MSGVGVWEKWRGDVKYNMYLCIICLMCKEGCEKYIKQKKFHSKIKTLSFDYW